MRILFLTNMYPPYDIGGYEQVCHEVAQGLKARGHEVKILTSRYGRPFLPDEDGEVLRSLYLQADLNYYRPVDFFLKRQAQERFNQDNLRSVLDDFAPDIVVVWGMYLLSHSLPHWLEQWMPERVVYYVASYWPSDEDPHRVYWKLSARTKIAERMKRPLRSLVVSQLQKEEYPPRLQFARTLCCSEYVKDRLVAAGKIPASSEVLYIGIDAAPFDENPTTRSDPERAPLRLLYFGRLIEDKGVHTAIQALSILKRQGFEENIELTVLGAGHPDYESRLRSMVSDLRVGEQVRFAGKVSRDEIPSVLSRYDVFLFTSIWPEPFGRTIVEAMLAGLIVIGSDVGGSREIFAKYDADLLYPAGDAGALASRLSLLLDGSKDKQQLVQRGRTLALERYALEAMITSFEGYIMQTAGMTEVRSGLPSIA
ncbi:MAG: glycosyltransferase family 4 protein [Anaerolineales bacterium]|nr:glycosyltransferase family 4 protein [Anaerolineales bacterium]